MIQQKKIKYLGNSDDRANQKMGRKDDHTDVHVPALNLL